MYFTLLCHAFCTAINVVPVLWGNYSLHLSKFKKIKHESSTLAGRSQSALLSASGSPLLLNGVCSVSGLSDDPVAFLTSSRVTDLLGLRDGSHGVTPMSADM